MRKDEDGRNARAQQEAAEDRLYVDPAKLRNTSDLTPVDQCRSPERKKPSRQPQEARGAQDTQHHVDRSELTEATQLAIKVYSAILKYYGGNKAGFGFMVDDPAHLGFKFMVEGQENEQAVASFFDAAKAVFSGNPQVKFDPAERAIFFEHENLFFNAATVFLQNARDASGAPLIGREEFFEVHEQMANACIHEFETPAWRAEFEEIVAGADQFDPELKDTIDSIFGDMAYPKSAKALCVGLQAAVEESRHRCDLNPEISIAGRIGNEAFQDEETGDLCFELTLGSIDQPADLEAYKVLEAFIEDLQTFPEARGVIFDTWIDEGVEYGDEESDEIKMTPATATFGIAFKGPREALALLKAYYLEYNLIAPEHISLSPSFRGNTGEPSAKRSFAQTYCHQIERGRGMIEKYPGTLLNFPARACISRDHADATVSLNQSWQVPIAIERIEDIVNHETGAKRPLNNPLNIEH